VSSVEAIRHIPRTEWGPAYYFPGWSSPRKKKKKGELTIKPFAEFHTRQFRADLPNVEVFHNRRLNFQTKGDYDLPAYILTYNEGKFGLDPEVFGKLI